MSRSVRCFLLFTFAFAIPMLAQSGAADGWHYSVTPYLWLPTINGELSYDLPPGAGSGRFEMEVGPNDYLSNLKFALMVTGEARNGRYSIGSDLVYLNFSGEESSVRSVDFGGGNLPVDANINRNSESSLKGLAWTVTGGYMLNHNADSPFDAIAGFRYFGVDSSAKWELTGTVTGPGGTRTFPRTGSVSQGTDLWDGIVGFRGRARLSDRWHVPYYADIGTGTSDLTWQAMTGVTYSYGWGDVGVVYRHVAYDQGKDGLLQNFSFSGPAMTFTFHF